MNEHLQLPIHVQDSLKECGWGVQEGRLKGNIFTTEHWVNGFTPEGGEPYIEFRIRAITAISDAIADHIPTLIVAHGGLFWAMMDVLGYRHRRIMNCIPIAFRPRQEPAHLWQVISLDPTYEIEL
jgi:broad specificity phosphatase PhoE